MSKGGSTTSKTEIPAWLEGAAKENINKARDVSELGYVPYYGPDVAAFSPMQQQSMQSTGNAASAFGLAPQGFDAMAGMPQAETFAGGVQGYSSAPLYQESIDQLQANRPAQYKAMTDMFIDPVTGAPPINDYRPPVIDTPPPVNGGGGGGGGGTTPTTGTGGDGNNDGAYFGVNDEYNPYKYTTPTEDISGDGTIDYRDMSFGEDGRRNIPWTEKVGDLLNPFSGIEKAIDVGGGLLFDLQGKGDAPMTKEEAVNQMNSGADRYEARLAEEALSNLPDTGPAGQYGQAVPAVEYPTYGPHGGYNFNEATTPTTQVEPVATPDLTFPRGLEEDLSLSAEVTPYGGHPLYGEQINATTGGKTAHRGLIEDLGLSAETTAYPESSITEESFGLLGTQTNDVTKAQEAKTRKAAEDKRIAAQAVKVKAEAANKAKIDAATKAKEVQTRKAAADKIAAAKVVKEKAEKEEAKKAADTKAAALKEIDLRLAEEEAENNAIAAKAKAKKMAADKAKAIADAKAVADAKAAKKVADKKKADEKAAKKKAADKLIKAAEAKAKKKADDKAAADAKVIADAAAKKKADAKAAKKKAADKLIKDAEAKAAAKVKADEKAAKKKAADKLIKDAEAAAAKAAKAAKARKAARGGGGGGTKTKKVKSKPYSQKAALAAKNGFGGISGGGGR